MCTLASITLPGTYIKTETQAHTNEIPIVSFSSYSFHPYMTGLEHNPISKKLSKKL